MLNIVKLIMPDSMSDIRTYENFSLKDYNSYRVNSICSRAWFPKNEEEIISIFTNRPLRKKIIIGNGNNIILSKEFYDEEFIIFNGCFDSISVSLEDNLIKAEAGATLKDLSMAALNHSLSGLEIFFDIPSSVGGAVVMNAGTRDGEIKDILIKVRYLDLSDLQIKEIGSNALEFEYRNSFFQKNTDKIVLVAYFRLVPGKQSRIKGKMKTYKAIRWSKQPRNFPNCGSVFKRPKGKHVGPMLDELGFKGFTIGGAKVSDKHSGFIINIGDATGKDIIAVIEEIQKRVKQKYGLVLEVEQRII